MEFVVGSVLWILANLVYLDDRRAGREGLRRLVAFWLGWPWTFVTLISVDEGSAPELRRDDEGLRDLVLEIRRDRHDRHERRDSRVPPSAPRSPDPPPHDEDAP